MTYNSWPFENADTTETQYSYLFRELQTPGVAASIGATDLGVTAGSGLKVSVATGRALARGYMLAVTSAETLEVPSAPTDGARIDRVVARFSPAGNAASLVVIAGSAGSSPAAPALTQTDTGDYDLPLAQVRIAAGQTQISAANITDERPFLGGQVGVWTTDTRPSTGRRQAATFGYNTTRNAWEHWNGSGFVDLIPAPPTWETLGGKPTTSTLDGRTITISTGRPADSFGKNGDLYFQY